MLPVQADAPAGPVRGRALAKHTASAPGETQRTRTHLVHIRARESRRFGRRLSTSVWSQVARDPGNLPVHLVLPGHQLQEGLAVPGGQCPLHPRHHPRAPPAHPALGRQACRRPACPLERWHHQSRLCRSSAVCSCSQALFLAVALSGACFSCYLLYVIKVSPLDPSPLPLHDTTSFD